MPIQINEGDGGNFLAVHVSGILAQADYERFVPEFERLVRQHGKLRVLFDMTGFHGWEAGRDLAGNQVRRQTPCRHRMPRDGWG